MRIADYLISGWSFFFRWPLANARQFRPLGVFSGPVLQSLVFAIFSCFGLVVLSEPVRYWAPAFGLAGLSMLTGFFHEDGFADTADSLGVSKFDSGSSLEKIHTAFKDPRLGTFGVSALVLLWVLRLNAVAQHEISIAVWCCICLVSRFISLWFGLYFSARSEVARNARSSHVMQSVEPVRAMIVLCVITVAGLGVCAGLSEVLFAGQGQFAVRLQWSSGPLLILCSAIAAGISYLVFSALVRRTEALNGDLLGAVVCFSELILTYCILRFF
ncbi:MAG: adenosylcobinamide-GDP ribazoletransferase [Proteobacteria bacterium]|nr:adenosylcobinamide-GDP ribazoletransferase [Pseudomonadota bacterium]